MNGSSLGSLWVNILAKTTGFNKPVDESKKKFGTFASSVTKQHQTMMKVLGGAVAGFGFARLAADLKETAASMDGLIDSANKIGIATDKLGALRHGANLSGVSVDTLDKGLMKMTRNLVEAGDGEKEISESLDRLGLSADKLLRMSVDEQFAAIADEIAKLDTEGRQAREAFEIFGKAGHELIPILKDGSAGVREFEHEAKKLGILFNDEQAEKVARVNDELDRLKILTGGIKQDIVIAIAPAASKFLADFRDTIAGLRGDPEKVGGTAAGGRSGFLDFGPFINSIVDWRTGQMINNQIEEENKRLRQEAAPVRNHIDRIGRADMSIQHNRDELLDVRERLQMEAAGGRAVAKLSDMIRDRLPGQATVNNGFRKFQEGFQKFDKFARDWAERDALSMLLKPRGAATDAFFRDQFLDDLDIEREMILAANEQARKDKGPVNRDDNAALVKGTLAAFKASRVNLSNSPELIEAKKQTDQLAQIERNTRSQGAVQVGIS